MTNFKILLILFLSCILCSCDTFRRLAGRPTSSDIAQLKKELIAQEELKFKARLDSLKKVELALRDSLSLLDSLRNQQYTILNDTKIGGLYTTRLEHRYYIVIGAFKDRANAEKLMKNVKNAGFSATMINFRNAYNAVALSPSDDLNFILRDIKKIKEQSFCPKDVWILVNE